MRWMEHVAEEKEVTQFKLQNPEGRGLFTDTGVNRRIRAKK
jgi:hypothetical protein